LCWYPSVHAKTSVVAYACALFFIAVLTVASAGSALAGVVKLVASQVTASHASVVSNFSLWLHVYVTLCVKPGAQVNTSVDAYGCAIAWDAVELL
jgi:hypothetical protein